PKRGGHGKNSTAHSANPGTAAHARRAMAASCSSGLQAGFGGHRLKETDCVLSLGAVENLDQGHESIAGLRGLQIHKSPEIWENGRRSSPAITIVSYSKGLPRRGHTLCTAQD